MITDVCLERVPVEWSVYMGNGCLWRAAMVLTADDHRCVSRAGPSGIGHVFIRNGHWSRIGRFLLEKGIVGVSLEGIVDYPDINTFFGHQLSVAFEFQLGLSNVAFFWKVKPE